MRNHESIILAGYFLKDSHDIVLAFLAHTHASTAHGVDGLPNRNESSDKVGSAAHGLGADNNLASILALVLKIRCPDLALGTHQRAHGDGDLAN